MSFQPGVAPPKWEYGYWAGTVRRWYEEGLVPTAAVPAHLGEADSVRGEAMGYKAGGFVDQDIHRRFRLDAALRRIPVNNYLLPEFPIEILADHGDWLEYRDRWGILRHERKDHSSPPAFVRGPIETLDDWHRLSEERLRPETPGRFPADWEQLVVQYAARDYPLALGGSHGFYGTPRYLLGDERLLVLFYDNPRLIHAINQHLCTFWIALYEHVLQSVTVDMALIWEDMCYKNGPLISPAMFREFLLPYLQRLCRFFRDHRIETIFVDTDGDARLIIPLLQEAGVNGLLPMEVAAGMDVVALREAFPRLRMIGGIDKRRLAQSAEAIEAELDCRVTPILAQGGFIPMADHLIPPDVSWSNFSHYRTKLNELMDGMV